MPYILAFDLGTTALKCALHGLDGKVLAKASEEYQLITPNADSVEMDAETYWQAFRSAVARVLKESQVNSNEIKALGVSAQGETLIVVDRDGKPLRRAIVWLDNRAQKEADRLGEIFGHRHAYEVTGQVKLVPTWPAYMSAKARLSRPRVIGISRLANGGMRCCRSWASQKSNSPITENQANPLESCEQKLRRSWA